MAESENGVTFALEDEDHTLANALRFFLNKNPHVSFCGYSIPHPAEALVNIRVQTTGETDCHATCVFCCDRSHKCTLCTDREQACKGDFDLSAGEITATEALRDAGQSLKEVCQHVRSTFKAANDSFDQTQSMQT